MSAVFAGTIMSSNVSDSALQSQIAALRDSLIKHRERARTMWNACAPGGNENAGESRVSLGRFTEKLLEGLSNEAACS